MDADVLRGSASPFLDCRSGRPEHWRGARFAIEEDGAPSLALRRFRSPVPARVHVEDGTPVRMTIERRGFSGGRVENVAGPWRTSGAWWRDDAWERDEWDVTLSDGATYRVFRERAADRWFVDGVVD